MTAAGQPVKTTRLTPDWVEVERLLSGRFTAAQVHPSAVRAACRQLTRQGMTATAIAARLGTSTRTVVRNRTRDRVEGVAG
ncbi:helix-turn-helix domain-containing protein [Pseudonocardia sp. NPDC049635]|uniref:helix-turn-helix domain-containing protein n=1 Tax=Pseudonocardia sp. NPDC049635 TaxID=3155506 RepID=UPI0033E9070D